MATIFKKSQDIVFRKIENEYILVPMVASAADVQCIFNLDPVGADIWERIDGVKSVGDIINELSEIYDASPAKIEHDVYEFLNDIVDAKIIQIS